MNFYICTMIMEFACDQAAEGARVSGASRIIGVDINPSRFEEGK